MLAVYGPRSWFCHIAKKQFFDQIWCFFYNKNKILTILFIVKYEKLTLYWTVFSVFGAIISRFFAWSNEEKNKPKQQSMHAQVLSLCIEQTANTYKLMRASERWLKIIEPNLNSQDWLIKTHLINSLLLTELMFLLCYQELFSIKLGPILDSSLFTYG